MDAIRWSGVTPREREVLGLLGRRLTNAEIAANLSISVRTAESHVASLLSRFGAEDRRELARIATRGDTEASGSRQRALGEDDDEPPTPALPGWPTMLRSLRSASGMTQEAWAQVIGVSRRTVQRWERGDSPPDAEAESALVSHAEETGLLGPLVRATEGERAVTAAGLRQALAEARLGSADHRPAAPRGELPSNLPAALTSFIGREPELVALRRSVGESRLVTLTGPGGCGKTRLALELAAEIRWAYPGGVWFVDLAPLDDPVMVAQTVAVAIGLPPGGRGHVAEALAGHLGHRQALLVLDNCEHLVTACAHLVEALLRACPHLTVVSTSREPLRVAGETVWSVPPLSLPGHDSPEALEDSDAVRLFVERTRQLRPGWALPDDAAAVTEICRKLDGMPLAIELASARVRLLDVQDIARRLDERFRLLTTGSRTALPRHRTLRAVIDWSYDALPPPEQRLFRRLGVFVGASSPAAMHAVASPPEDGPVGRARADPRDDVRDTQLDLFGTLVDRSLIAVEELDGANCYRLLETLREYALEKLQLADETATFHRRHRDWYLEFAEVAAGELHGSDQTVWLARLELERDNLRAALAWSLAQGEVDEALRIATSVWWFWRLRGYFGEGRRWLEAILAEGVRSPPSRRAEALRGLGILAHGEGDYQRATQAFEEAAALYERLDDRLGFGRTLNNVAMIAWEQGRFDDAETTWRECLGTFQHLDDRRGLAIVSNNLGLVAREQGRYEEAAQLWDECLTRYRELGDEQGIAGALANLGQLRVEQDDLAAADDFYAASLAMRQALGDRHGTSVVLASQAAVAAERGELDRADHLLGASLEIATETGDRQRIAYALSGQGHVAALRGDLDDAMALYTDALEQFRDLGERLGIAGACLGVATVATRRGDHERAQTAGDEAFTLYGEMGHQRGLASVTRLLEAPPEGETGGARVEA